MIRASAITAAIRTARMHGLRGTVTVWLAPNDQVHVTEGESPELGAEVVGTYDPSARCCFSRTCASLASRANGIITTREVEA